MAKRWNIGIDFGTANIMAAVFRNDHMEIIPDEDGNLSMPAYIAFTDHGRLFGSSGKAHASLHPSSSVYNVKMLIGRQITDSAIQNELGALPFKIVDKNGQITFQIAQKEAELELSTVEIISMLLGRVKRNASAYLNTSVLGTVITVPAQYNMRQRQVVKDAALIAGFDVLKVTSTPAAILFGYSYEHGSAPDEHNVMAIDIGAGFLNVGCAKIEEGICEMMATACDVNAGGAYYDSQLFYHCCKVAWSEGIDVRNDNRAIHRLRRACEAAKRELSFADKYDIELISLLNGRDFYISLTRVFVEGLFQESFKSILPLIDRVLDSSKMNKGSIHEVLFSGGSSEIPGQQKIWKKYFNWDSKPKFRHSNDFELMGASIEASILSGDTSSPTTNYCLLLDNAFLPLGIEIDAFKMATLACSTTILPTEKSKEFRWDTKCDFLTEKTVIGESGPQTRPAFISIYEGENTATRDNDLLKSVNIESLMPEWVDCYPILEVSFDIDRASNLQVTVRMKREEGDMPYMVEKVMPSDLGLSRVEIESILMIAEKYDEIDQEEESRISVRRSLERSLEILGEDGRYSAIIEPILSWLEKNEFASKEDHEKQEEQLKLIMKNQVNSQRTKVASSIVDNVFDDYREVPIIEDDKEKTIMPDKQSLDTMFRLSKRKDNELNSSKGIYTDANFKRVSTFLRNTGHTSWENIPKLYTTLRLINHPDAVNLFTECGMTDFWFPFTSSTLPLSLPPDIQREFLKVQTLVYSESKSYQLERAEYKHAHFSKDDPLPFKVIAKMGRGAHGTVDKVMSTFSQHEYARKLFRKPKALGSSSNFQDVTTFLNELGILKRVRHRHCISLVATYSDPKYFGLLIEPVGDCNLAEFYEKATGHDNNLSILRSFFGCLASSVEYLHGAQIRHRDIKPQNVIVKGDQVFLADFGISYSWENLTKATTTADSGKTMIYAAPEVVRVEPRSTSADVWSLGCIFFEMASILMGKSVRELNDYFLKQAETRSFYANIGNLRSWANQLMTSSSRVDHVVFNWALDMLQENPAKRPTAGSLLNAISAESNRTGVMFCGTCCLENDDSTTDEEDHGAHIWSSNGRW